MPRRRTATRPTVRILGTHGVPAAYGGFETAAENVGLYLADHGWRVVVYCQSEGDGPVVCDTWRGLERVTIAERRPGWRGTSSFDLKAVRHAQAQYRPGEVWLTFGYNTGIFALSPKLRGIPHVINMDGLEWTRRRWGVAKQAILLANERFAGLLGDVLIADHPEIARYLRRHFGRRRVTTITYGAREVRGSSIEPLRELGLEPGRFATVVCRPIPENSVLEIVRAWSSRPRGTRLVVIGPYGEADPYHRAVRAAASAEVDFPGAIFEPERLAALREHSCLYLHGHTVGGTNPSLVEAMAAGNPVVAHDNPFNRWVAPGQSAFFRGAADLSEHLDALLPDETRRTAMGRASRARFDEEFTWDHIGRQYDDVLRGCVSSRYSDHSQKIGVVA